MTLCTAKWGLMNDRVEIVICMGSSCFSRGNQHLLCDIRDWVEQQPWHERITLRGSRCEGACMQGPNVRINGRILHSATLDKVQTGVIEALGAECHESH